MEDRKTRFFDRISKLSEDFTPSERKIADHLFRTYPRCLLKNASEIAGELGVNVSTVTRFFKKIGFKTIRDAHLEFKEDVDFIISSPLDRIGKGKEKGDVFAEAANLDILNIQNTMHSVDRQKFSAFVDLLSRKQASVFVTGDRSKPFSLAYYFYIQHKLIRSGTWLLGTDKSVVAQTLVNVGEQDVLVVFDFRRYSRLTGEIVDLFHALGGSVIVFTDSPLSPNAQKADEFFLIETKSPFLFDSYTAGFTLINLVIAQLAELLSTEIGERYRRLEAVYKDLHIFE